MTDYKWFPVILLVILFPVLISSQLLSNEGTSSSCQVQVCNQEYLLAAEAHRISQERQEHGRHLSSHRRNTSSTQRRQQREDKKRYCSLLHSYNLCMKGLSKSCIGNLDYHSVLSMVRKWMQQQDCQGSHHKSRQGVKSSTSTAEQVIQQYKKEEMAKKEQRRIQRCIRAVFNYTFDPLQEDSDMRSRRRISRSGKKRNRQLVRNGQSSVHASIYDEGIVREDDQEEKEEEQLVERVMTPDQPLSIEEIKQLYSKDEEPLICSLFGDPHLRTFDGRFQTCRVVGAWPLLDHPLFAVQVTNSRNSSKKNQVVSGVTKVTVVIKNFLICGIEQDLVYEAGIDQEMDEENEEEEYTPKWRPLPNTFIDGSSSTRNSLVKVTLRSDNEVCIQMDHLRVQVCVYKTPSPSASSFLNVIVKFKKIMSGEERSLMIDTMDHRGLCSSGCPTQERIDVQGILQAVGFDPLQINSSSSLVDECKGLQGYYYVACLFDIKMKGSTREDIQAHRFCQDMDDISIVKRSLLMETSMMISASMSSNSETMYRRWSYLMSLTFAFLLFNMR